MTRWLIVLALFAGSVSAAKPYRVMVTRTTETTGAGNLELGLRYQGFLLGSGRTGLSASPWHQLAGHARFAITDYLELDTQVEVLLERTRYGEPARAHLGDIPIGLQWRFFKRRHFSLGLLLRGTVPTGPSDVDVLPPTVSDGTLDFEGTLLAEVRITPNLRILGNVGFLYHGVRKRGSRPDFDVPEAIRYDLALAANVTPRILLALELMGRSFFDRRITPVWEDNQHLVEVIPGVRFETAPGLVLELALGVSATRDLREMYLLRPLLGLTYEFSL